MVVVEVEAGSPLGLGARDDGYPFMGSESFLSNASHVGTVLEVLYEPQ